MNSLVQHGSFETTTEKTLKWTSRENKDFCKRHIWVSYIFFRSESHMPSVAINMSGILKGLQLQIQCLSSGWRKNQFYWRQGSHTFVSKGAGYLTFHLFFRVIARLTRAWWSPHVLIKTLFRQLQVIASKIIMVRPQHYCSMWQKR